MIILSFSWGGVIPLTLSSHSVRPTTEVQPSFVCSTEGKGSKPRLWNIHHFGAKASGTEEGMAVAATGTQPQIIGLHAGSGKLAPLLRSAFP